MKDFLKFTLATVTGIILSSIVLFIISMVTLFGIMSASDTETIVKRNSVMMLDLNGTLVERTQEDPLGILSQLLGDGSNTYGLDDILSSIQKAKEIENIKGIYLQANSLGTSYASCRKSATHCSTSRKWKFVLLMQTPIRRDFIIFPAQPIRCCSIPKE